MFGWSASYRLHFGFPNPPSAADVHATSAWAAEIDIPNRYFGDAIGRIRSASSYFTDVRAYLLGAGPQLESLFLIPSAVQRGGDSTFPVLSAGMSYQVEWITGERGKGVNGRTYFPYWGQTSFSGASLDSLEPLAATVVLDVCNAFAADTPTAIGADLVVCSRVRFGAPVSPLGSRKVTAVVIRSSEFQHQRRRVQYRKRFTPNFT
jgi:hypothetical protein